MIAESSAVMELGIAIHCAVLEPARFETEYVALPDTSHLATPAKKAALTKAAKKDITDSHRIALSFADYQMVTQMAEAFVADADSRQSNAASGQYSAFRFESCEEVSRGSTSLGFGVLAGADGDSFNRCEELGWDSI